MAWTYGNDPSSSTRDAVRFLVQDIDTNRQLVSDEEIAFALAEHTNTYFAAALVADSLALAKGNIATKRVGDLSITYDPSFYGRLAKMLRRQGALRTGVPYAGGISVADKETNEADTDRVQPMFTRELHTVPGGTVGADEEAA